jgi:hypothetical protein
MNLPFQIDAVVPLLIGLAMYRPWVCHHALWIDSRFIASGGS